jgi:YggT family protein
MNAAYFTIPLIFLIDSLFSLYILAVILRFLLQCVRADFYNPISQFLLKITHPPLKFLRRYIPPIRKIDTASIVLALLLQMITDVTILFLQQVNTSIITLTLISFSQLISLSLNIFIFAIFVQALLSWFNPNNYNPAIALLTHLTNPILNFCRRFIPDLGGFDLSPLVAVILLQLTKMLILPPLERLAYFMGS